MLVAHVSLVVGALTWFTQIQTLMVSAPAAPFPAALVLALLDIEQRPSGEASSWLDSVGDHDCEFAGFALPSVFTDSGTCRGTCCR